MFRLVRVWNVIVHQLYEPSITIAQGMDDSPAAGVYAPAGIGPPTESHLITLALATDAKVPHSAGIPIGELL